MNIKKTPSNLRQQLEAIMPAVNPELAEEAVQLYADLWQIEGALRALQTATESLTDKWMREGLSRFVATVAESEAAR